MLQSRTDVLKDAIKSKQWHLLQTEAHTTPVRDISKTIYWICDNLAKGEKCRYLPISLKKSFDILWEALDGQNITLSKSSKAVIESKIREYKELADSNNEATKALVGISETIDGHIELHVSSGSTAYTRATRATRASSYPGGKFLEGKPGDDDDYPATGAAPDDEAPVGAPKDEPKGPSLGESHAGTPLLGGGGGSGGRGHTGSSAGVELPDVAAGMDKDDVEAAGEVDPVEGSGWCC